MICIHNINLNSHCEDCFKESRGTNQRGITSKRDEIIEFWNDNKDKYHLINLETNNPSIPLLGDGGALDFAAAYAEHNNPTEVLLTIKDFLEWGAKTGSDRELFDDRFRKILKNAKVEFTEPEY